MGRSRVAQVASYALVVVLAVEAAVWESFLVGARPLGTTLPVAALLAAVGNVGLGVSGARVLRRRAGAAVPGLIWLVIALELGSKRTEGDLVVPDSGRGVAFLVVGALTAAVVVGASRPRGEARATPGGLTGR